MGKIITQLKYCRLVHSYKNRDILRIIDAISNAERKNKQIYGENPLIEI